MSSDDARIGYFEQRSKCRTAMDDGELLAPAADMEQMQQIITNSTVNRVLQPMSRRDFERHRSQDKERNPQSRCC